MDALTHAILGMTLAEAGWRRRLGPRAVVFGALAAWLPDIDFLTALAGNWSFMVHHRSGTHSLFVLALAAPLVGWLDWRLRFWRGPPPDRPDSPLELPAPVRPAGAWTWIALAACALLTHALLDLCTSYGTQIFWPLHDRRYALDAVSILDLCYSLPLLLAALLACLRRTPRRFSRRLARGVLVATTLYLALGGGLSRWAVARAEGELQAAGFRPVEVRAVPTFLNIVLFRVVARDAGGNLRVGYLSALAPRPIEFQRLDRPADPLAAEVLASAHGREFAWFAMEMVSVTVNRAAEGGRTDAVVRLRDERYAMLTQPDESRFAVLARFDRDGQLQEMQRLNYSYPRLSARRELAAIWRAIRTGETPVPTSPPTAAPSRPGR